METERYTDKLAKYIIFVAIAAVAAVLCWYFRNIIIYIFRGRSNCLPLKLLV